METVLVAEMYLPIERGVLHLNPGLIFRPDYEVPVQAVVDYALARPDVDPERLARSSS